MVFSGVQGSCGAGCPSSLGPCDLCRRLCLDVIPFVFEGGGVATVTRIT